MKKIFTLIAATLLVAACSDDTDIRTGGDFRHISFGVTDGDAVSVMVEDFPATRFGMSPWAMESYEDRAADAAETVVAAETDMPVDERLCLSVTDEPFIRRRAYTEFTRGSLLNTVNTRSLVFGVTEFLKDQNIPVFANTVPVAQNTTLDGGRELFIADETWEDDAYDGNEYDFFAYAPSVEGSARGITLSNQNRTISYDPTGIDVGDQPDLMTARKATSAYVGVVPLTFQHRLCAIQIKTSGTWAQGYHVSGVTLTNVVTSGTFDVDTDKDDAWTTKGEKTDYTVTGIVEADATDAIITGGNKWLMMVPQTLDHAMISVTLTDGDSHSYTVTAPVNGSVWTAGHTVTYTVRPESIATMTVNYPAWNDGGNPVPGPVSTYDTTDQFGLFVLDKDGKILVSNQLVAPVAGSAAASRSLDIPTSIFKSKQYKYFLMYPYKTDAELETIVGTANYNSYYRQNATGRTANADAFFADVVANWTAATDQSTEATFKAQDLQIASLAGADFNMEHKMGLLACTLPDAVTTKDVITYDGNSYDASAVGEKWTKIDSKCTTTTWSASTIFTSSTDKPYNSGSSLYYIAKPANDVIAISATDGTQLYSWSVSGASTTIADANDYKIFTITVPDLSEVYNKKVWEFDYSGAGKTWVAPYEGTYTIECWGAGLNASAGCRGGGYVAGDISLSESMLLYAYVGQTCIQSTNYNFNGGGPSSTKNGSTGYTGSGATDVRTTGGTWNLAASLRSRIIVAGGAACVSTDTDNSGSAGGLTGYQGRHTANGTNYDTYCGRGGGQTFGGAIPTQATGSAVNGTAGAFGMGGKGGASSNTSGSHGGGGGWYGGSGACGAGVGGFGGGGGSSFISGHPYCNGINSSGVHQGASQPSKVLYQGTGSEHTVTFTNTLMIDGGGYRWTSSSRGSLQQMPNPAGGYYASGVGHSGNGYCKITYTRP